MNTQKLENWWQRYKKYPKLNINEVKTLYLQYQKTNDYKILEEMINGTMYLIYNNLKKYYYLNYNTIDFDIEDIIMNSIEIWLKFLKSGKILRLKLYSEFFRKNFHYELINMTLKSSLINVSTMKLYGLGYKKMASLFFMYVHGLNNSDISLELRDVFKKLNIVAEQLNINLKIVPSRKFEIILKPLIYSMIKEDLNYKIEVENEYEKVINQVCYEQIERLVNFKSRSSIILKSYCGFYSDKPKSTNQLAKEYNCTRQNIEQIMNREVKRIRKIIK